MRITPRSVSVIAILILLIVWLLPTSSITKEPVTFEGDEGETFTIDLCAMWAQMPWTLRLGIISYLVPDVAVPRILKQERPTLACDPRVRRGRFCR